LIVAGGEIEDAEWLRVEAMNASILVAADRGAEALNAVGILPHVLIGDLDSADADTVAHLEGAGVPIERYPSDKEATDLALAIDAAIARGATRLRIAGALRQAPGGLPRLDHLYGNLSALAGVGKRAIDARLVAPDAEVTIVTGPGGSDLIGTVGDHVSLVPLSERVDGTTTNGLRWALTDASLPWGTTQGVSNELASPCAHVSVASGHLLVALQRHRKGTNDPGR
jgi:thiamine pyrophosphokinase